MRGGGYRGRGTPPVPSSDEDAEVGAELGERGGRGAPDAAGAAKHEHAASSPGRQRPWWRVRRQEARMLGPWPWRPFGGLIA